MRQMLLVQGVPLEIIMIQKTTYHVEEAIFPLPCWKCQNLEENIFFFWVWQKLLWNPVYESVAFLNNKFS